MPLERFKALIGAECGCADTTLAALLLEARDYILGYTGRTVMPEALTSAQVRLAAIYYNRMGIEGDRRFTEGGVTHEIEALPADMERLLNAYRVIRIVR